MKILLISLLILFTIVISHAEAKSIGQSTGYKVPRFVSTKSNESNLRIGPDTDFPIQLTYEIKNFPLEIIEEYEVWRKVLDIDGNLGWIHKNLIKGDRYGVIKTFHEQPAQIYKKPKGIVIGTIGNRNIVKVNKCFDIWCHINFKKNKGWINKENIWGVYNNEKFNMPSYQLVINLYWKLI